MGCVYFMKHRGLDPVKIGMSTHNNPFDRIEAMETASPFGIELLGFIKTDDPIKLERAYHSKFFSLHVKGEWFSVSVEKINSILDYHNDNKVVLQIENIIEELEISPREALNYIKKLRLPPPFKETTFERDLKQIYFTIVETNNSSWVSKKEILEAYSKKFRCSKQRTYLIFKKVEMFFSSYKEGRKVFLRPKGMKE